MGRRYRPPAGARHDPAHGRAIVSEAEARARIRAERDSPEYRAAKAELLGKRHSGALGAR